MTAFGTGSDRLLGVVLLLFFGGGGTMWYLITRPRAKPVPGLQLGTVSHSGNRQPAFIARSDRGLMLAAALGGLAMGVGALLMVLLPDGAGRLGDVERVLLGVSGAFFVGIGFFALFKTSNSSDLALTRDGLRATGPAGWFVRWDAIVGTGEIAVYDHPFLAINVTDSSAIDMGRLQRLVHWSQRSMMGLDLSFPLRMLAVEPAELHAAIGRYMEHPELRGRIGLPDELATIRETATREDATSVAEVRRLSVRRILGIGSLFAVGGFLALFSLLAALDDVRPDQERARLLGFALFGILALAQIAAAVLLLHGRQSGRWIGLLAAFATLGLALLGLVRSEPDDRSVGIVLVAIVAVHVLLVAIGARLPDRQPREQGGGKVPGQVRGRGGAGLSPPT